MRLPQSWHTEMNVGIYNSANLREFSFLACFWTADLVENTHTQIWTATYKPCPSLGGLELWLAPLLFNYAHNKWLWMDGWVDGWMDQFWTWIRTTHGDSLAPVLFQYLYTIQALPGSSVSRAGVSCIDENVWVYFPLFAVCHSMLFSPSFCHSSVK